MAEGKQVSVILKNEPGELARLSEIFERNNINILAISIQNAKNFLMELFRAREKDRPQNYYGGSLSRDSQRDRLLFTYTSPR